METNFQMLRALNEEYDKKPHTRGFITAEDIKLVKSTLCLDQMDVLALRNLRDFTVLFLSGEKDPAKAYDNMDKISAYVSVIDREIVSKGGEV